MKEEDIYIVFDELVNNKDFQKSDTKIETYESRDELKFPQDYDDWGFTILDDLKDKEVNYPRVQVMFERSRHKNLSILIISQDYYALPKKTIRANGKIYHIFKPKKFLDVRNIYQDKSSMDTTLNKFKYLTSTYWNEKYQPPLIDMTKNRFCGRYRLGLILIFVPETNPF